MLAKRSDHALHRRGLLIGGTMDVVDLCAGDGWFTLQIAKIARQVLAIDIDPPMLDVARHRLSEGGIDNCEFIVGDAYDIAKLAGPADFVFMITIIITLNTTIINTSMCIEITTCGRLSST